MVDELWDVNEVKSCFLVNISYEICILMILIIGYVDGIMFGDIKFYECNYGIGVIL